MTGQGDARVAYCTVEDIQRALDVQPSASAYRRIARHVLSSSGFIEGLLNRRFYPAADVRYFDWPLNYQYAMPWRLWLDANEIISVNSITTGSAVLYPDRIESAGRVTTLTETPWILRPENTGPPYSHIEIRLSSGAMWAPGSNTWQQAVAINGVFGGCGDTEPAGQLAAAVTDTTGTTVTVTDSAAVGTLDTILVGTEWMTVTRKRMATTGLTLAADLPASQAAGTVQTTGTGALVEDETLLIGGERARVLDVAGTTAIVKRAVDGSTLAAHTTGAAIYAPRALTVTRGTLGSTAATHTLAAPAHRLAVPELVRSLAVAQAILGLEDDSMGWTTSKGEEGRVSLMRDLQDLRNEAYTRWARQSRIRAV